MMVAFTWFMILSIIATALFIMLRHSYFVAGQLVVLILGINLGISIWGAVLQLLITGFALYRVVYAAHYNYELIEEKIGNKERYFTMNGHHSIKKRF